MCSGVMMYVFRGDDVCVQCSGVMMYVFTGDDDVFTGDDNVCVQCSGDDVCVHDVCVHG